MISDFCHDVRREPFMLFVSLDGIFSYNCSYTQEPSWFYLTFCFPPCFSCSCSSSSSSVMSTSASWEAAAIWCLCWEPMSWLIGPLCTMLVFRISYVPGVCGFLKSSAEASCIQWYFRKHPALPTPKSVLSCTTWIPKLSCLILQVSQRGFLSAILFSCFGYSICCPELEDKSHLELGGRNIVVSRAPRGQNTWMLFSLPAVFTALFYFRVISYCRGPLRT